MSINNKRNKGKPRHGNQGGKRQHSDDGFKGGKRQHSEERNHHGKKRPYSKDGSKGGKGQHSEERDNRNKRQPEERDNRNNRQPEERNKRGKKRHHEEKDTRSRRQQVEDRDRVSNRPRFEGGASFEREARNPGGREHSGRERLPEKDKNIIWIYGRHAVLAAFKNPSRKILRVLATKSNIEEIGMLIPIKSQEVEMRTLYDILGENAVHQGIAIEVRPLPEITIESIFTDQQPKLLVILDQLTDPHNVGAILRSCAAFDVDAVIMPKDNTPSESTILAKSASGALEVVPLVKVTNLASTMKYIKEQGFWCLGLDGAAKTTLNDAPDYEKVALIMGGEGAGLRRLTSENCDMLVKLRVSDKVESLNVSNAAAIALYELRNNLIK